jgi:large conductance mechanosensitive channel
VLGVLKGFRDFILRGNVIELAVAVVIGAAFNAVVAKFSEAFVKPLIELASGGGELSGSFKINEVEFPWSGFVNAAIAFLITAAVVYFVFVLPMNQINERRARRNGPVAPAVSDEIRLLTEIRDALVTQPQRTGDPGR